MSRILKVASVASLALTTTAALSVTDQSFALEAAKTPVETNIVVDPALVSSPEETGMDSPVVFGEPREVAAEIPQGMIDADKRANEINAARSSDGQSSDKQAAGFTNNGARSLRQLVNQQAVGGALSKEMQCLAGTVYFESKGESLSGQLAVARVVMARAKSSRFPNSICGVVYQRSQFSFVRGGRMPHINKSSQSWRNAVAISKIAMNNGWKSRVEGALFFHARYVSPRWRLKRMATIDNHIFYR